MENPKLSIQNHRNKVAYYLNAVATAVYNRSQNHDLSALEGPESGMHEEAFEALKASKEAFGADQIVEKALERAKNYHFVVNRHHPEHFERGISGMNLIDLLEMLCDWKAKAAQAGTSVDLDHFSVKYNISGQLLGVLKNTLDAF